MSLTSPASVRMTIVNKNCVRHLEFMHDVLSPGRISLSASYRCACFHLILQECEGDIVSAFPS